MDVLHKDRPAFLQMTLLFDVIAASLLAVGIITILSMLSRQTRLKRIK